MELQTLWTKGTAPGDIPRGSSAELHHLASLPQRRLTHGVGSPIGGTICDQERHVQEFRHWTEELSAPWTSEHLSILDVAGADGSHPCGFLMPPVQTDQQATLAAANITRRAEAIGKPIAFETGVNYFAARPFEMSDGDFFAAVAEEADCGILLDLNNLWCNAKNGRDSILEVVAKLPLERVWEVHLAGAEFAHGHWLDAHSGAIDPELVAMAADVVAALPNLGAIIFELSPGRLEEFGEDAFLKEIETLHRLWNIRRPAATLSTPHIRQTASDGLSPEAWERLIAIRLLPAVCRPAVTEEESRLSASDQSSFGLYETLIASFRNGAIADLLPHTLRLLLIAMGKAPVRDLLAGYAALQPPSTYPTDEALGFSRFLGGLAVPMPGLEDMLAFETAAIQAAADSRTIRVTVKRDIGLVLDDLAAKRIPGPTSERPAVVLEIGVVPGPFVRVVHQTG